MDTPDILVLQASYTNPVHAEAIGLVLNHYAEDPMGGGHSLPADRLEQLPAGDYHVTLWHPQLAGMQPLDGGTLKIPAAGLSHRVSMSLEPASADLPPTPSAFGDAFNRAARETAQ